MEGLEVTPLNPSSSISRFNSPEVIIPRRTKSDHTLCPSASSLRSGFSAISLPSLRKCINLREPAPMPLCTDVPSGQKCSYQVHRQLEPDDPPSEAHDVHVVVFDSLMGREVVRDERRTHAIQFVCGDAGADST